MAEKSSSEKIENYGDLSMQSPDTPPAGAGGALDEKAVKLLRKALAASPEDWETRSYLVTHYAAAKAWELARACLAEAPGPPTSEDDLLLSAQVEAEFDQGAAIRSLSSILEQNKACAGAYLQLAQIYRRQGLKEEARKKYGAATLLDETLTDPEWESWLGHASNSGVTPSPQPVTSEGALASDGVSADEIAQAVKDATASAIPLVTFADIGGMSDVIDRIRMNIIYPFKNPEVFRKFNRKPGGGILLYGPPGCGKTHIARATAGECGATFCSIAITDVLSKWLGESERHLHEIFETARRRAPTVVFIDEIDAIGMSRGEASATVAPIVNVLLTEMDGISSDNTNVMVLAATNAPWRVDSALRRPGRFDRVLFVPPPDASARAAILDINLRDIPNEGVDTAKIARQTEKYSGADLRALVLRASDHAILAEMKCAAGGKLTQKMLLDAAKEMRPSTAEWLETARSYASYANRSGLYDELVEYFERH
jgi:transitional endoplasmic reticulum ATPase